jgi:hypothetical protein
MSLKKKFRMRTKEIYVVLIVAPVKNEAELEKILGNTEGISEFAEKFRN